MSICWHHGSITCMKGRRDLLMRNLVYLSTRSHTIFMSTSTTSTPITTIIPTPTLTRSNTRGLDGTSSTIGSITSGVGFTNIAGIGVSGPFLRDDCSRDGFFDSKGVLGGPYHLLTKSTKIIFIFISEIMDLL
jgi:hypothetical protein